MDKEDLKQHFLQEWPKERLVNMTLNEYTNLDKKESFCYWLETKTQHLGSIWGGSSYKFGVYRKQSTSINTNKGYLSDDEYAWVAKYGHTATEAFETVKSLIIKIAEAAHSNHLDEIDKIDLGPAYRWKIAFLYSDYKVINIFRPEALQFVAESLGMSNTANVPLSALHKFLISHKPNNENYYEFTGRLWHEYEASLTDTRDSADLIPTSIEREITNKSYPLNTILYGPPGTGKTYNTIALAVELITGKKDASHFENKKTFDLLMKGGQIEFITFHQNYSYEDFVVGIKPDLDKADLMFKKNEGIFYKICDRARQEYNKHGAKKLDYIKPQAQSSSSLSLKPFEEVFREYFNSLIEDRKDIEIAMKSGKTLKIIEVNGDSIRLEYHNGTKDHTLTKPTLKKAYEDRNAFESGKFIKGGPRRNYEYVLEKLWELGNHSTTIKHSNTVLQLKNYVLIIDEINRANISRVFGELITLLEEDKRIGAENEMRLTLPNGEQDFALPPNLYILGTMNTADKSIALVDIALRRRFEFRGFYPTKTTIDELATEGKLHKDVPTLLAVLNKKIFDKKGADFLVGHAYFINKNTDQDLYITLKRKVIPLLMEYFSGKVDLVRELFNNSGYSITYDTDNYDWSIVKD